MEVQNKKKLCDIKIARSFEYRHFVSLRRGVIIGLSKMQTMKCIG